MPKKDTFNLKPIEFTKTPFFKRVANASKNCATLLDLIEKNPYKKGKKPTYQANNKGGVIVFPEGYFIISIQLNGYEKQILFPWIMKNCKIINEAS